MSNSSPSSRPPLRALSNSSLIAFLAIAIIGFADATYLTVEHFMSAIPPCSIVEGCQTVLSSSYAVIFGIPTSLLGSLYYLAIAAGALIFLDSRLGGGEPSPVRLMILKSTLWATAVGLAMSLWFLYLQAFVLHAYCIYCLGSATTSTVLFVFAMIVLMTHPREA